MRSVLFQCRLAAQSGRKLTSLSVLHFVTVHAPSLFKGNMNAGTGPQLKCDFMATWVHFLHAAQCTSLAVSSLTERGQCCTSNVQKCFYLFIFFPPTMYSSAATRWKSLQRRNNRKKNTQTHRNACMAECNLGMHSTSAPPPLPHPLPRLVREIVSYLNRQTPPLHTGGGGGNRTPAVISLLAHLSKQLNPPPCFEITSLRFTALDQEIKPPPPPVIIPSVFAFRQADDRLPRGGSAS